MKKPPYGYFWWLLPGGYEGEGIFGQTVSIFPADHVVVVINSAWGKGSGTTASTPPATDTSPRIRAAGPSSVRL